MATALDSGTQLARFQAIAEETRLRIVQLLTRGERCVCELQAAMDAQQSRLSFHLRKLKDAGVVSDRKDGRWVYYSLVPEALEEMRAFLGAVTSEERGWASAAESEPSAGNGCAPDAGCCG